MTGSVEMKDFTKKREPVWFRINGVDLRAKPAVGMATVQRVMTVNESLKSGTEADKLSKLAELFGLLLHSGSVDAFNTVMADEDDPVDTDQLTDMLNYVMEKQGLRPTQPSTESSKSPSNGPLGTPGEDGVSPVA
jgi:hypothetical protein